MRIIVAFLVIAQFGPMLIKCSSDGINTVYEWKRFQYEYDSDMDRERDIASGYYVPDAPQPIDVDVYYHSIGRLVFVSVPKFAEGIPATLGYVLDKTYEGDPVVQPFPTWEWNRYTKSTIKAEECPQRLISVLRMKIDKCGLFWIMDSGSDNGEIICPPKIVVFDLKRWPLIKKPLFVYEYPTEVYEVDSIFANIALDTRGRDCRATRYTYAADITKYALIVTDLAYEFSWKVESPTMAAEPAFEEFEIAGDNFTLQDGIVGLAIYPQGADPKHQHLFFSSLAGSKEHRINLKQLNNNFQPPITTYRTPRKAQSIAIAINKDGIAFFGLTTNISIDCWNAQSGDYGNYIHPVYVNPVTMQFASGVKILRNECKKEELWVLTNRFQHIGAYNFSEINFRISMGRVSNLLRNSPCQYPNV